MWRLRNDNFIAKVGELLRSDSMELSFPIILLIPKYLVYCYTHKIIANMEIIHCFFGGGQFKTAFLGNGFNNNIYKSYNVT